MKTRFSLFGLNLSEQSNLHQLNASKIWSCWLKTGISILPRQKPWTVGSRLSKGCSPHHLALPENTTTHTLTLSMFLVSQRIEQQRLAIPTPLWLSHMNLTRLSWKLDTKWKVGHRMLTWLSSNSPSTWKTPSAPQLYTNQQSNNTLLVQQSTMVCLVLGQREKLLNP